ncbi:MAG: hypothetical protein IPN42_10580 [Methylococcaceae bacterium]|nr:hypothetical protein [Methylococcaceae bacterium]
MLEQWANIPLELQNRTQWVIAGKDKIPLSANGKKADVTNSSTWCDFNTACLLAQNSNLNIGYVLSIDDPYTCIDLDVIDEETQISKGQPINPAKWTTQEDLNRYREIVEVLDSYSEKSLSGKGLHIWVKGKIGSGMRRDGVEVYSQERFIICTGNGLTNSTIHDRQEILNRMQSQMRTNQVKTDLVDHPEVLSDEEIIDKAKNASNSDKFTSVTSSTYL